MGHWTNWRYKMDSFYTFLLNPFDCQVRSEEMWLNLALLPSPCCSQEMFSCLGNSTKKGTHTWFHPLAIYSIKLTEQREYYGIVKLLGYRWVLKQGTRSGSAVVTGAQCGRNTVLLTVSVWECWRQRMPDPSGVFFEAQLGKIRYFLRECGLRSLGRRRSAVEGLTGELKRRVQPLACSGLLLRGSSVV